MAKRKFSLHLTVLALACFCLLTFSANWPLKVHSQSPPTAIAQIHFATPPEAAPAFARREESRSRCPCYSSSQPLTALIPASNLALTATAHPTFFLYVPHATGDGKTANHAVDREQFEVEFELADQQQQRVYQTTFNIVSTPGIVSFTLPATAPPLEPKKYYHWYFEVICDRDDRSGDSVVSGWSRRVELTPTQVQALAQASPLEKPRIYAQAGLWHDLLATIAELRRPQPGNPLLGVVWVELLKSVGLEKVAQEPLVNCCTQPTEETGDRSMLKDRPLKKETGC